MKLPESFYFLRPGWWATHVVLVLLFVALGARLGIHLALDHGIGGHRHDGAHAHAEHAPHDHADSEALRPLMREMLVSLVAAQSALDRGDARAAQPRLQALATACDENGEHEHEHAHEPDPASVGPRFAEIDRQLHGGAADLARVAATGDLEATRRGFAAVTSACVSCHQQAPAAHDVDLGRVVAETAPH